MRPPRYPLLLLGLLALSVPFVHRSPAAVAEVHVASAAPPHGPQRNDAAAAAAFEAIVPVLHNPRCMNCHMVGNYPRQGDDSHPHIMRVQRGADGEGVAPVRCSTCHQDHNLVGLHMPPGAPGWGLPPASMPMIWQGLSDRQLCQLFKDEDRNGHKSIPEIVEHMGTPLVLWGWHPGEGRTPIPQSQQAFLENVRAWAAAGAACPAR